ncbi:hypothetical protein [Priestia aryabhattai]
MKNLRKIGLGLVASLLSVSLVACGSTKEEQQQEAAKQQEQQQKEQEGKKAKLHLQEKVTALEEEYDNYMDGQEYMDHQDFGSFKKDFNVLAKSIKSSKLLDINDTEKNANSLKYLKNSVDELSNTQVINADKRYGSAKDVYEVAMGEEIHYLLQYEDVHYSHNAMNSFYEKSKPYGKNISVEKSDELATEGIESLQDVPKSKLDNLKESLEKYQSNFTDEEYDNLNSAVLNLSSSLDSQVKLLQHLTMYYVSDGMAPEDLLDNAINDFNDAKSTIDDFEKQLGVEISDERYKNM